MNNQRNILNIENMQYELDDNKIPMWYVFTTHIDVDEGNIEHITVVIGPSTQDSDEVIAWVKNEIVGDGKGRVLTYQGGFDHEPSPKELSQFAPIGYEDVISPAL